MAAAQLPALLLACCLVKASLAGQLPAAKATVQTADAVPGSGRRAREGASSSTPGGGGAATASDDK